MLLEGSCRCGAVRFSVRSRHPYPFQRCSCSICRKTAGGGGYAIHLRGDSKTLVVEGEELVRAYQARIQNPKDDAPWTSEARRQFCRHCGSFLWLFDPEWPEMVHPFASAIDTLLPVPPERTHIMLAFKAPWVSVEAGPNVLFFDRYPEASIDDWHRRLELFDEG